MKTKILCVAGARPNFMKVAPLYRALDAAPDFTPVLVHTGQHYDAALSGDFFRDLGLPAPAWNLEAGSASHAQQTAAIMSRFEPVVTAERPDAVLVAGDVNSTVACALVAAKMRVPVLHAEAGLRSFDRAMPEEINRVVTDAISDVLLVSEPSGVRNLLAEGASPARIHLVGNLMIDSLRRHLPAAEQTGIRERLGLGGRPFGLVTLHRPSNVDSPARLAELLSVLAAISRRMPLYFPVHPRTRHRLEELNRELPAALGLLPPLGYLEFLGLMKSSTVVLTDSGGIQEETTALGIPCLTLRDSTERPATIEEGTNLLAGTARETILRAWEQFERCPKKGRIPDLWDGKAAERCVEALRRRWLPLPAA